MKPSRKRIRCSEFVEETKKMYTGSSNIIINKNPTAQWFIIFSFLPCTWILHE